MTEQIYAVKATDVDRDHIIVYAMGDPKDIEEVYRDKGGYGLKIEHITIARITPEAAEKIRGLRANKIVAENNLKLINQELSKLGVK